MPRVKPSDLELQILSVLWRGGAMTAREVREAMPDGKERAYTSVLSVMQVMEKKGLLEHERAERAYVYRPAVSKREALGPVLRDMVSNVFGGRVSGAVQQMLSETAPSREELDEMRAMIDAWESEAKPVRRRGKKGGKR